MQGLGLLGLLVVIAIIFVVMFRGGGNLDTINEAKKQATEQANQIAGREASGERVTRAVQLSLEQSGGRTRGVVVDSIDESGAIARAYGLKSGDVILEMGVVPAADITDASSAADWLQDAYQRSQPLKVRRGGETITLTPAGGSSLPVQVPGLR